jgi:hypothetical protein
MNFIRPRILTAALFSPFVALVVPISSSAAAPMMPAQAAPMMPAQAAPMMPAQASPMMMMAAQAKADPTTLIKLNKYGSFIQAVSGPFSLPGVVSATFKVNRGSALGDGEFTRIVVPVSHTFDDIKIGEGVLYSEMTFTYSDQKQNEMWMQGTANQMMVRHNVTTTSLMGGVGADFEPMEGLVIRPIVHLGWSRIKDDSNPTTAMGKMFRSLAGEDLFIWEVGQLQYGPAIEAEHSTIIGNDIKLNTGLRFTQLNIKTISTSTPGLEESSKFDSISGNFEMDGPTSVSLYGRDMRWQYFMGGTRFDNATSDALKFSWVGEIGTGISFIDSQENLPFVETLGVAASVIIGGNEVSGWTFSIKANF